MGCSESKIEKEEAVLRCKDRKEFMSKAVLSRNAFAAAHVTYSMSLKNSGAALSDFAYGEVSNPNSLISISSSTSAPPDLSASASSAIPQPPPNLPPPPPPIPDLEPSTPLQRAVSMPQFVVSKPRVAARDTPIAEEKDPEEEEEEVESFTRRRGKTQVEEDRFRQESVHSHQNTNTPPPPLPAQPTGDPAWDYFFNVEVPGGTLDDVDQRTNTVYRAVNNPTRSETVVIEEEEEEEEEERESSSLRMPMWMKKGKQAVGVGTGFASGSGSGSGEGEGGKKRSVNIVKLFGQLDDCFLKASESAHDVSKLLEAARLHYHSNFADNRGHIDHSARLMRVITWNRSFRGLPNVNDFKDEFASEEDETHATVLDKLLAWEKKLYDEVKAGEIMKFDYQRKVALLNKQKKRGSNSESLEKIKATVSQLHTRYIVDMQSMDSTVSEISHLRDDQLYPKLVALVDAMARMWDTMQGYHLHQLKISAALSLVDISQSSKETTDEHHERTIQLWAVFQEWHIQFENMVSNQKKYISALNSWLRLNLIPIESSLKEKVLSSPPRPQNPPIQTLLLAWHDLLDKLPDEHAKSAIYNFAAVLHTLLQQQDDEIGYKVKMEESRISLEKKQRHFNKWVTEYLQRKAATNDENSEPGGGLFEDGIHKDELMVEREFIVESAKRKLEEDTEIWQRHCVQVRDKSLTSLKTRLPELFRALSDFAHASAQMYNNLKNIISHSQSSQKLKETAA